MEKGPTNETPLFCNLNALDPAQRERHQANTEQLFGAVEQIEELPEGYAFRWPAESVTILKVADFISLDAYAVLSLILRLSLRLKMDRFGSSCQAGRGLNSLYWRSLALHRLLASYSRLIRNRRYFPLWLGQLISNLGDNGWVDPKSL